jgi:YidC/Oxa1 family membrane protein insertase
MDSLRLFAAMVFAVSVFLLFDAWNQGTKPSASCAGSGRTPKRDADTFLVSPPGTFRTSAPAKPAPTDAIPAAANISLIHVRTDVLAAEIDPVGGTLRRLEFLHHRDKLDNTKNFVLFQKDAVHTYCGPERVDRR